MTEHFLVITCTSITSGAVKLTLMPPPPKHTLLEAMQTRNHFIKSFASDKPWDGDVLCAPHNHTHTSRPRKCLTPTMFNQPLYIIIGTLQRTFQLYVHWGKADDSNCNYGHPKIADVESSKNLFC